MNTKITYLYRDAANYKETESVVVSGRMSLGDVLLYLDEGEYFAPADVGLPHPGPKLASWPDEDDDHCWCSLDAESFEPTDEDATLTAAELLGRFRQAFAAGWPAQTAAPV